MLMTMPKEVEQKSTTKMEPVPYGRILAHIMETFSAKEQMVSIYVMKSTHLLISMGLLFSNTYHLPNDGGEWFSVEEKTTVGPCRKMTDLLYGEIA
jgi:hypothetical protein